MVLNKVWSQGQLFAFSALDGTSTFTDDFVGTLSGDRLGIKFYSKVKRELIFINSSKVFKEYKAVTGDYIEVVNSDNSSLKIVYADRHIVIGNTANNCDPVILVEGDFNSKIIDGINVQDTLDGQLTGLKITGNTFCFAFAQSVDVLTEKINKGLSMNIQEEIVKKQAMYNEFSLPESNEFAPLYSKCLSTMKTQLYSPEAKFKRIWSTPDRLPHKYLWLWDSVFHGIGHSNYDLTIGEDLILSIFDTQRDDGFIPHLSTPNWQSDITQPPIIAWGANIVYGRSKNKDFIKTVFYCNKKFLNWCKENRRDSEELYTWFTGEDVNCRCDESGMDNSPRFDKHARLQAIDFSCFMANDVRNMAIIAEELGLEKEAEEYNDWFIKIKNTINKKLWDNEDGFYYDYDLTDNKLHKVASVASFLPIFAGVCDKKQAQILITEHLLNREEFYTEFPIPSISRKDVTFGSDMWRGPVWINYNYMISCGLREYGYNDLSDEIVDKTIKYLNEWYLKKGVMFEFYDSENKKAPNELNRKGSPIEPYNFELRMQAIRDYGWSNTLLFDLLHNKYYK